MSEFKRAIRWIRLLLLVSYWAAMFIGTHIPGRLIHTPMTNDKVLHFSAFSGLAFLLAWVFTPLRPSRKTLLATVIIAAAYATMDEWTQAFVPNRTCDLRDWVADMTGTLIGLLAYLFSWAVASGLYASLPRSAAISAVSPEAPEVIG